METRETMKDLAERKVMSQAMQTAYAAWCDDNTDLVELVRRLNGVAARALTEHRRP